MLVLVLLLVLVRVPAPGAAKPARSMHSQRNRWAGELLDGPLAGARFAASKHLDDRRKLLLDQVAAGKGILLRIVAMLTKLLERFLGPGALG